MSRNRRDDEEYAREMVKWANTWDTAFETAERQRQARSAAQELTVPVAIPQEREIETKYAKALAQFQHSAGELAERARRLAERAPSVTTLALAQELGGDIKRWDTAFEIEARPRRSILYAAHMAFCNLCTRVRLPVDYANKVADNIITSWHREQKRKAEAERLERERIAREAAETLRKAQVDAQVAEAARHESTDPPLAQAILQEAQVLEQAPLVVVVPPVKAPPKLDGYNVRYKFVGEIRSTADLAAFLRWIVDGERWEIHRELFANPSKSGMTALLTRHCSEGPGGTIIGVPPGITAAQEAISVNRQKDRYQDPEPFI